MIEMLDGILNFDKSIIKNEIEKFHSYWDCLRSLNDIIIKIGKSLDKTKYKEVKPNVWISHSANIHNSVNIIGPCIVDDNAELRYNAFIRENVIIGKGCVIGNSCEVKNSILFDEAKIPHFNYIGDSILGNNAHFGAGALTSNVKSDSSFIKVILNDNIYQTHMRKLGSIVGDNVEIGCNAVLSPGVVIGRNSTIYPLTMVRGEVKSNKIVKSMDNIITKKKENNL